MTCSILWSAPEAGAAALRSEQPGCFHDLHLDRIVAAATAGRDNRDLPLIFNTTLPDAQAIRYRQDVFRDFERPAVFAAMSSFCARMRAVRDSLAQARKLRYALQSRRWQLDAAGEYCETVNALVRELTAAGPRSQGMALMRRCVEEYARSERFGALAAATAKLQADLARIVYTLRIHGKKVIVARYVGEPDYAAEVLATFDKFRQSAVEERVFRFQSVPEMNHVEAAILERVARLNAGAFTALEQYCEQWASFQDATLVALDREAQFYLAWLEYLGPLRPAGLAYCYPQMRTEDKSVSALEIFDLALARQLATSGSAVVVNDVELGGEERILVISGANQGGKTTLARAIGQLCYLATLGCPVPGRRVRLPWIDRVLTHFEREERVGTLRGKLEESLGRMRRLLERASPRSLLVMNESFDSTTPGDALFLSKEVLNQVTGRDMLCVCVTFLDELGSLSERTVSYVATVDARDPALRTFKIVRRPAEGLAHAVAIARKYGLTYERIKDRIAP